MVVLEGLWEVKYPACVCKASSGAGAGLAGRCFDLLKKWKNNLFSGFRCHPHLCFWDTFRGVEGGWEWDGRGEVFDLFCVFLLPCKGQNSIL